MSSFCAGKKRDRRLKQTNRAADEVQEDEEDDEIPETDSSDPMMGHTFNECKLPTSILIANLHIDFDQHPQLLVFFLFQNSWQKKTVGDKWHKFFVGYMLSVVKVLLILCLCV